MSLRADYYRQDPDWRVVGSGSPDIQTFSARWFEVNFGKTFYGPILGAMRMP